MIELCDAYKKVFQKHSGKPFPQDPLKQLELAIEAVFKSWMQPTGGHVSPKSKTSPACSAPP